MRSPHQLLKKLNRQRGREAAAFRDRPGKVLFIGTRNLGYMVNRVIRAFTDEDTVRVF